MAKRLIPVLAALLLLASPATAASDPYDPEVLADLKKATPENEASVEAGKPLYLKYCAGCHGDEGEGNGGSAPYLDPRPRDFTRSLFKFRSTQSGELPTDEDLYRTISRGATGTAMPAWGEGPRRLTEAERWQIVYYLKKLGGEDFEDEDFDPYKALVPYPQPPGETAERIANGKTIFADETQGGCIKCHGPSGRGNGKEAGTQEDDWGDAIMPADMTKGWRYKNGTSVREIYRTFSTGMTGTPMPGYGETLSDGDRWSLAYYVRSLIEPHDMSGERVLAVSQQQDIPDDPAAEAWLAVDAVDIPLTGQVVRKPRLASAAVDMVTVRAMYNEREIAFHFTWNDRSESRVEPLSTDEVAGTDAIDDPYVEAKEIWQRRKMGLGDSLQLQIPFKVGADGSLPFFYLGGGPGGGVGLWRWFAGRERPFVERSQKGAGKAAVDRPAEEQALEGAARYDDGRWMLVMRRKYPEGRKRDVTFNPGSFVPFALQAWDGGNGEAGLLCSIGSWEWMRLETPIPRRAYIGAVVGFGGMQLIMLLIVAWARRAAARNKGALGVSAA